MSHPLLRAIAAPTAALALLSLTACAPVAEADTTLVVYSGRSEELVQPLIDIFEDETGITVDVRYGDSAELAAQLAEEGDATKADLFFAQDAGALGAIESAGLLTELPTEILDRVPAEYRSATGQWVGVTGRARVLVYNPELVTELPATVAELAEPEWAERIAVAPTNASFQSFVTAYRVVNGDAAAAEWLDGIADNAQIFEKNGQILDAVEAGTVAAGLINHYYWFQRQNEVGEGNMASALASFQSGDVGNLINVAGIGAVSDSALATQFIEFLLRDDIQEYFVTEVVEYPLVDGIAIPAGLTPLSEIAVPDIDLTSLEGLEATLALIRESGLL